MTISGNSSPLKEKGYVSISIRKLFLLALAMALYIVPVLAANIPAVRIAVVPGSGSGIEQEIVDRISRQLEVTPDVVLSPVNPDWFVVCNIHESIDQVSGAVRYNGNVIVKTKDDHVIHTAAVQKYNQDFSLQPGAPLNKKLVDNAAREVIASASDRVIAPIQQAVVIEMAAREAIIRAEILADDDNYDEAMAVLRPVTPDTPNFKAVRDLIDEFEMEKESLALMKASEIKAKRGAYTEAIVLLERVVKNKSKRAELAKTKIASYKAAMNRGRSQARRPGAHKPTKASAPSELEQLKKKALEATKTAAQLQQKVIDAERKSR